MGTPDPGPRRSSRIADQGTHPDYTNRTRDRAMVMREIVTEPENLKEAEGRPDWPIWKQAMKVEMDQHNDIGTWQLVELPTGRTAIGCRWVYAVKTTPDGNFEKAKSPSSHTGVHPTTRDGLLRYHLTSGEIRLHLDHPHDGKPP